jgi:hypothetical protein
VPHMALDVRDAIARVQFVPATVEVLGNETKLRDQHSRQVEWSFLAALFAPETQEGLLVLAHDDPRVRASNEVTAVAYAC